MSSAIASKAGAEARPRGRSIFRAIARRIANQRDYDALLNAPDHRLRDIGLTREQIRRAKQAHAASWLSWRDL